MANKYLTLEDRKKIAEMYESEARVVDIAYRIGCHPSTIYDELRRGDTGTLDKNQRHGYDPVKGQKAAMEAIRARGNRCKKVKTYNTKEDKGHEEADRIVQGAAR